MLGTGSADAAGAGATSGEIAVDAGFAGARAGSRTPAGFSAALTVGDVLPLADGVGPALVCAGRNRNHAPAATITASSTSAGTEEPRCIGTDTLDSSDCVVVVAAPLEVRADTKVVPLEFAATCEGAGEIAGGEVGNGDVGNGDVGGGEAGAGDCAAGNGDSARGRASVASMR